MSQTTSPARTRPDADTDVSSLDVDDISERALAEEEPPDLKGVRKVTEDEIRFQRRTSVVLTVGPLIGLAAAIWALWGNGMTGLDLGLFLGFYAVTGFGVTVGYHRLFTHQSFTVPNWLRGVIAVSGSMAIQGALIDWVATHRRHHAYSDEYGDPHSPHLVEKPGLKGVLYGLWHAHMGWLFMPQGTERERWAPDLTSDPLMQRIDRNFPWIALTGLIAPAVLGFALSGGSFWAAFTGFLWGGVVRLFLLHHVTWSINSICHFFGEQPFESRDEARNNWPLSVLSFGESWHNNHHAFPSSARHGLLRGQLDPSWRFIRTLEQLGLAEDVRLPSQSILERRWADEPKPLAR